MIGAGEADVRRPRWLVEAHWDSSVRSFRDNFDRGLPPEGWVIDWD